MAGAALLYMVLAETTATPLPGQGLEQLLQPASGLALVLLVVGGRQLAPALFMGSLFSGLLAGDAPLAALAQALGTVTAAWVSCVLLLRQPDFDRDHPKFKVVQHLLLWVCGVGAGAGALVESTGGLLAGEIAPSDWTEHVLHWWSSCALGSLLIAPFAMSYRRALRFAEPLRRVDEGLLVWVLAIACAIAIFGNTQIPVLAPLANAYWMFLFVSWSGARVGLLSTTGLLCMIALQALWGTYQRTGFFAHDIATSHGFGYWSFMMILAVVGLSLAAHIAELRRQKAALRVAAIAFECQEGMLITDEHSVILQANQSFLHMSGYEAPGVLGKTPHFLQPAADTLPDSPEPPAPLDFAPRHALQCRAWLRRKSGEVYPAWITLSPVKDLQARTTHYVVTMTDITDLHQQEAQRRQREQAQRDALVQEVHHRIKNNLQGIMGMLRTLDHDHPELHGPITQVIGQIHSISVIHGLQGRANADQVRLCELISAVAANIESLWHTPIHVDIPTPWEPCRVNPTEAVPVALVLNELMLNAVKHGGKEHQDVQITLRKGAQADHVQITIANPGHWPATPPPLRGGQSLVCALMPRSGATLTHTQIAHLAVLRLEFSPPVIHLESAPAP
ncbi:MAG TPA: MASE1 domain-containing protein [Giesbergeria sp.]|nr:MASE1 domain-containing protein [Giesbergeria sp.]